MIPVFVTSKYSNKKTVVDGIVFDSKREACRYQSLKLLEAAGHITDLQLQVRYDFEINGVKLGYYRADFVYQDESGSNVVEDSKGMKTPVYRLKKKLMKALHGIEILET